MQELFLVTGSNCKYCGVQRSQLIDAGLEFKELDVSDNHPLVSKAALMGLPQVIITDGQDNIKHASAGLTGAKEVKELLCRHKQ